MFDRFLSQGRKIQPTLPDIDLDYYFCDFYSDYSQKGPLFMISSFEQKISMATTYTSVTTVLEYLLNDLEKINNNEITFFFIEKAKKYNFKNTNDYLNKIINLKELNLI